MQLPISDHLPRGVSDHCRGGHVPYQVPLSLRLGLLVIPRLVSEGLALPHVLEDGVYQRFTDQNAQVHDEEHVHRSRHKTATALSDRLMKSLPRAPGQTRRQDTDHTF